MLRKMTAAVFALLALLCALGEEAVYPESAFFPEGTEFVLTEDGGRRYETFLGDVWVVYDEEGIARGEISLAYAGDITAGEFLREKWPEALIVRENEDGILFVGSGIAGEGVQEDGKLVIEAVFGEYLDETKLTAQGARAVLGFLRPGVQVTETELDSDDGMLIYEGEALVNGVEYEFEINAYTGRLLEWERD